MLDPPADLSLFRKNIRSKLRLSIYMSKLLHFMYLVIKNFPDYANKYETFLDLVKDVDFTKKVLTKESRFGRPESDPFKYLKLTGALQERGYLGLLELANIIWDLTVHHRLIDHRSLFDSIIGLRQGFLDEIKIYGKASYRHNPFILNIRLFNFVIIESELSERTESLAKTLIYIGKLVDADKSLGLFARFSIRSIDAEYMIVNQEKGNVYFLLKPFRVYPTLLRMQRFAYKKVEPRRNFDNELLNLLSEIYITENQLLSLIDNDIPANILAMAPSITLQGGLCFVSAFRGELLNILGTEAEAKIRVADTIIKAYPSYNTVLKRNNYPGEYLFVAFHPFTIPRIGIIIASFPVDLLDKIKPKRRNVLSLNKLFPKVRELIEIHY